LAPAFAVGNGLNVNVLVEGTVCVLHAPEPVAVKVKVTFPAEISAALAVYVGDRVFAFTKEPVPLEVHNMLDVLETDAPDAVKLSLEQIVEFPPALAVGIGLIVNVFVSVTVLAIHKPIPVPVNVNVTDPAVLSAALGVYVGVKVVPLANVPVPLVLHK